MAALSLTLPCQQSQELLVLQSLFNTVFFFLTIASESSVGVETFV